MNERLVKGTQKTTELTEGWELARAEAGAFAQPENLGGLAWAPAVVPGTVALGLGADFDTIGRYHRHDWWYRCRFTAVVGGVQRLRFGGLATIAEVWLNGQRLLQSKNMFASHKVDVTQHLRADNELVICLRSLDHELAQRKPRPRWKTALVDQQNLRWVRTTLLGRMPGWTPPIEPVGVWQAVALDAVSSFDVSDIDLQVTAQGNEGHIRFQCCVDGEGVTEAHLRVGDQRLVLVVANGQIRGDLALKNVPLWWPHTHGTPTLMPCSLELKQGAQLLTHDLGRIGFKALHVERGNGLVQFQVNGVPVFCRGACWTTDDFRALHGDVNSLRRTLTLARDAGLNMLRVGGTMTYESDAFYTLCDELGILVWQEFMFANMDYPVEDPAFGAEIDREAAQQLQRFQSHVCIAAYCGGSEVEQQAAMLSLPEADWSNAFFRESLPALCARLHSGIPYFRSSPSEGPLPFHVAEGIAHYYGVGAYRRPISDVKHAAVKFATECLGFANVPETETMELLLDGGAIPPAHHPKWKARQPRDNGAGWDFEDIRDHYLQQLFGVDPIALRGTDTERYYALSRVVSGEVMKRVYAEWRSAGSVCNGALVWFLKDLWPGAGWGVIDSTGRPKAAYWHLKRAWQPRTVLITDQGVDGLALNVVNEAAGPLRATLEFVLYQHGRVKTAGASQPVEIPPRSTTKVHADALLGHFHDTAYAYRFGPPQHDVAVARLVAEDGGVLAEDFHFPSGMNLAVQTPMQLSANARRESDGRVRLDIACDTFMQNVHFDSPGYRPDDAYFHLAPGTARGVLFVPLDDTPRKFKAHVNALNLRDSMTARCD